VVNYGRFSERRSIKREIRELRARFDAGDRRVAYRLGELLAKVGRSDELRARAEAGDSYAAEHLGRLLAAQGRIDELRDLADSSDSHIVSQLLHSTLAVQGRLDVLQARAEAGNGYAARTLVTALVDARRFDDAVAVEARFDAAHTSALDAGVLGLLVSLLIGHGRVEEALDIQRARADAGDSDAACNLAFLLLEHGRLDELRTRADTSDSDDAREAACDALARLLAEQDCVEELRARADAGDSYARNDLIFLLRERSTGELRALVDDGDTYAAVALARQLENPRSDREVSAFIDLLAERGSIDQLRALVGESDLAAYRLTRLFTDQGRVDDAIAVWVDRAEARPEDHAPAYRLAQMLAEHGRIDQLRARADADDAYAVFSLADLLAEQGQVDEAITLLQAHPHSPDRLVKLLLDEDRIDEAVAVRRAAARVPGARESRDQQNARILAELGHFDELRAALKSDLHGDFRLAHLLVQLGRVEELRFFPDTGDVAEEHREVQDAPPSRDADATEPPFVSGTGR
jgi:thioredoxin-like negative regulator of GroEL